MLISSMTITVPFVTITCNRYVNVWKSFFLISPKWTCAFSGQKNLVSTRWRHSSNCRAINESYAPDDLRALSLLSSTLNWPDCYLDLSSFDYFLWGYPKPKVFKHRPTIREVFIVIQMANSFEAVYTEAGPPFGR